MWVPHADGKSVIGLFYDSFVATDVCKMENGKWKIVGANYAGEFIRRYSPNGSRK